jgi:cellobiose phosphorylase
MQTYKVEPYVVTADVYAVAPHTGRGGWSWYTGSAGWMNRLIVESLLGLRRHGERLTLAPVLPADWPAFTLDYRYRDTLYRIDVRQIDAEHAPPLLLDGEPQATPDIALVDDGLEHSVEIRLPRRR